MCGSKTYCKDMATCAEAHYFLTVCGLDRLDADSDGIPCETICGKQLGTMNARIRAQPFMPAVETVDNAADEPSTNTKALGFVQTTATCGSKRTCRQMLSCEEATFYLTQCGVRSLDGNGDGIACNGLCRR